MNSLNGVPSPQCKEQFQVQESYKRVVSMGEGKVIRECSVPFTCIQVMTDSDFWIVIFVFFTHLQNDLLSLSVVFFLCSSAVSILAIWLLSSLSSLDCCWFHQLYYQVHFDYLNHGDSRLEKLSQAFHKLGEEKTLQGRDQETWVCFDASVHPWLTRFCDSMGDIRGAL